MKKGRFIVLEGIDGAGKSTQANLLRDYLQETGHRVVMTAEPTALPSGVQLRRVLSGEVKKNEYEAALMFVADRIAHNMDENDGIGMHLAAGRDVICDRYYYSSLAYQGSAVDYDWVKQINLACPAICKPDLCIFLDLTPEESLRRISANREQTEIYENTETLTRVRASFHRVLEDLAGTDRIVCIDASEAPQRVAEHIRDAVSML